ncbi:MAG: hypothetical protein ABI686_09590 [Acidobacteriota bacterium]
MTTIRETKQKMLADSHWWKLYFYDFVDDFRRHRDLRMITEPFELSDDKTDALLASTIEKLCDELKLEIPLWIKKIPPTKEPYFVSGLENLKAILIVQSPLRFKIRNVFVSEDFLSRV